MSKQSSTFEREMKKPAFRKKFEKEYKDFLLSELIKSLMEGDQKSVRTLAKETDLSPTVIQKLRTGAQKDVRLNNFLKISHACGYNVVLEKADDRIQL